MDVKYAKYEQNSDHYYFLQNRVPAVCFIFDKGENFTKLHTVKDDKDNISYKSFHKIFDIITQFIDKY